MKKLILLAAALLSLITVQAEPTVSWIGGSTLRIDYTVTEPFPQYWSYTPVNGPTLQGSYVEHVATTTQQSCTPDAPLNLVTERVNSDTYSYYDHANPNGNVLMTFFSWDTFHWANYLQQAPGYWHTHTDNWSGTVVNSTDYNYVGAYINYSMRQATFNRPVQVFGYQPGTMEVGTVNGRQYIKAFYTGGVGNVILTIKLISTSIDRVSGMNFAPHFFRINTSDNGNVKGRTSAPFNDVTRETTIICVPGQWYDITPSYVNPPAQYDFDYSVGISHGDPK